MFDSAFVLSSFEPLSDGDPLLPERIMVVDASNQFLVLQLNGRLWLTSDELTSFIYACEAKALFEPIVIGHDTDNRYCVAVVNLPAVPSHNAPVAWTGLRELMSVVEADIFAVIARGVMLGRWRIEHRFCGRCGRKTSGDRIDPARVCKPCRLRFYPRIAPCMIVVVRRGSQILLAHHKRSTRPVYSPLAGFIEAGETAEASVAREVAEEVGIQIKNIRYFSSQSWPFPGQLMLGFYADYAGGELHWNPNELIDAKWFEMTELPQTPEATSIAGRLINSLIDGLDNH